MTGSIDQAIADGIENSKLVVVCVTRRYIAKCCSPSDNCASEFTYSFTQLGNSGLVYVVMEACVHSHKEWHGPVGLRGCAELHYDCSADVTSLEFQNLVTKSNEDCGFSEIWRVGREYLA
eukprot:c22696_g1_i1.p1 GENE.c22696_g1_i1~~c22696_g1_i1.p1  ORF type:complete len:120 (-),score=29.12 c22696_g1_i1:26-385(-)